MRKKRVDLWATPSLTFPFVYLRVYIIRFCIIAGDCYFKLLIILLMKYFTFSFCNAVCMLPRLQM